MSSTADPSRKTPRRARIVAPKASVRVRLSEIVGYRELLGNLVRKELKVKYKNSALGFMWSLLNPLLYLVIFSLVLGVFLRFGLPWYAFYLLSGLLAWNLFATALSGTTASIVSNSALVSKVFFPREILPLASIGAALVHFVLQLVVLLLAMGMFRYVRFWDVGLTLLPVALAVQLLLILGFGLMLASANVYFRDVQHLLELALLAWFWMTPIVYASAWAQEALAEVNRWVWGLYLANPMTPIVLGYQRALYAQRTVVQGEEVTPVLVHMPLDWYFRRLGYVAVFGVALVAFGWWLFRRLESRLAEEL